MIRPARPADMPAILQLAESWYAAYTGLKPDPARARKALSELIAQPSTHYASVSSTDGKVRGALLGRQCQNLWARKNNLAVLFWVSQIPGDGARMLRHLIHWMNHRPTIRASVMQIDAPVDPRVYTLAQRIGFRMSGSSLVWFKGERNGTV